MGQIVLDIGMIDIQRAGRWVVAITLFGDRQRHDPYVRFRHRGQHCVGVFGRDQNVIQNGDPARLFPLGCERNRRIGPILPAQGIPRIGTTQ